MSRMETEEVLKYLESLPEEERQELVDKTVNKFDNVKFIPNPGPQSDAYYSKADILLYGGSAGAGKGLRPDEPILTPFGFRALKDLKVGSAISATDGSVQRVIGYYPRGKQKCFKLKWSDNTETICDSDHIWTGWFSGKSKKVKNKKLFCQSFNITTSMLYEHYSKDLKRKVRFGVPVIDDPSAFNVAGQKKGRDKFIKREFPAYALGALLGDGCFTKNGIELTSTDDEIFKRLHSSVTEKYGAHKFSYQEDSRNKVINYRLRQACGWEDLRDLGLVGTRSDTKFIPRIYLHASIQERFDLLQGLMDTDGYFSEKKQRSIYTTVSRQLAEDVAFLVRSLGGIAKISEKQKYYTYNNEKKKGKPSYDVDIKLPYPEMAFSLKRKKEPASKVNFQSMAVWLESIEEVEEQKTICIRVSHPNSLFIAGNFRVTHNTGLITGLALSCHKKSHIFRRKYADLSAIAEDLLKMYGSRKGFSTMPRPKLRTSDERLIEFGACQHQGDEQAWQGQAADLKAFDEVTQFLENQFRYIITWNRTTDENQRCRVIAASNPPTSADGDWVIQYWGPWLDPNHDNPAEYGELRWFVTDPDGNDFEVPDDKPYQFPGQSKPVQPKSRTFIPGRLQDNPYLVRTDYAATLDSLPEPLRSAMRDGNFMLSRSDADFQVIPSDWIRQAQARWKKYPPQDVPMSSISADVAQGGADENIIGWRHDWWFSEQIAIPGKDTPLGTDISGHIIANRQDGADVIVDVGGGYGGAAYKTLKDNEIKCFGYNGAAKGKGRTKDGKLKFVNKRARDWWMLREALDPAQPGGSKIALPPCNKLAADLAAPTYTLQSNGIKVESKIDIKKRLGRSPDRGDQVVMCWSKGDKGSEAVAVLGGEKHGLSGLMSKAPKVVLGHKNKRRR